uniref:Uncharacterized protein n=1 Tax=viral metagenome TaxID=1070528 RepID=A0A6M3J211_9ZZZZ
MEAKVKCPECNSPDTRKYGVVWRDRKKVQGYQCKRCGRYFREEEK